MIPPYTLPEMGAIWSEATCFSGCSSRSRWRWSGRGRAAGWCGRRPGRHRGGPGPRARAGPPARRRAAPRRDRLPDRLRGGVGEAAEHVHYGMTSSDLLDTTLALQLTRACDLLARRLDRLVGRCRAAPWSTATLCLGRTHGVAAEPTFGLKLAGYAFAFDRDRRGWPPPGTRSPSARGQVPRQPRRIEAEVLEELSLARAGPDPGRGPRPPPYNWPPGRGRRRRRAAGHRVRHPSAPRSGAEEPFAEGQKGSSACPTSATRSWPSAWSAWHGCCGATPPPGWRTSPSGTSATSPTRRSSGSPSRRLLRARLRPGAGPLAGRGPPRVSPERMQANLEASGGLAGSSAALLALVDAG